MDFIKYFDLFEIKFHFYLNKQPYYQNVFGGFMTFVFYIICILSFILFSYDELNKLNPNSSKSEIPDAGLRTVNILKEKIWIPFRMVTYEEQFVDHRGILFPRLYYIEGKWDNKIGMDLKYHLLNYKLCNETSMANKPDSFKINVPLNELFCIDNDDVPFGGSWNADYLYYLEYNLHLCEDGINFNASDPRCTKIEDLLKHRSTSWLFEFYYPVVQFQPTNYEVPLAVIYRSYFYRLATHSNKVERIYISQHVLSDDRSILNSKAKNSSYWGMSSLYGDDYYMEYTVDPLVKSTSSRLYSLDIYMDQGMVYYTRSYKKLFLIIADFFPILKLILYILKKCTQHIKMSFSKRKLAGILFEKVKLNQIKNISKIQRSSYSSLNNLANKLNNNSKKELNNNENEDFSYAQNFENNFEFNINIKKAKPRTINDFLINKNAENERINNNISNNKSNLSLKNENIIQILNNQAITKINSNKRRNSVFTFHGSKLKEPSDIQKKKINKNKKEELFPYFYFFLDFLFDKFKRPKKLCCVPKQYFIVYNFMCQIYDISTHIILMKQCSILNKILFEIINGGKNVCPFEVNSKININDNYSLEKLGKEMKSTKCLIFSNAL